MKFAQYLDNAQTPEWKKAYIDYKGLKKQITKIRESRLQSPGSAVNAISGSSTKPGRHHHISISLAEASQSQPSLSHASLGIQPGPVRRSQYGSMNTTPPLNNELNVSTPSALALPPAFLSPDMSAASHADGDRTSVSSRRLSPIRSQSDSMLSYSSHSHPVASVRDLHDIHEEEPAVDITDTPRGRRLLDTIMRRRPTRRPSKHSSQQHIFTSLSSLYPALTVTERKFFEILDAEVDKVDEFYCEREREAQIRFSALKEQLREFKDHGKQLRDLRPASTWTLSRALDVTGLHTLTHPLSSNGDKSNMHERNPVAIGRDIEEYQHAKKRLKKAMLEFYRGLELLKNYRIINSTGFRKALKKFDKITKLSTQSLYLTETVELRHIADGERIEAMLKETEDLYAGRFSHGDRKKAQNRLRATYDDRSHHLSTFRSGIMLGLAVPALASGIYQSFKAHVREAIPQWAALLQIYGALIVPVFFSLLVGINLQVWRVNRINWIFIFELDVRTAIDTRVYFELPAFLLSTLIYAFWLSFSLYTVPKLDPMNLPAIWLLLVMTVLFNPLPIFVKDSRRWFLKVWGRLFLSGLRRVEFMDFWMGDQFCSLVYTSSQLYFLACSYITSFRDPWQQCTTNQNNWVYYFLLAALPNFIRFVQSIKRYVDSRLWTHLINAGKYFSSMVAYVAYYNWRRQGSPHNGSLALYCIFAAIMSTYTSSWDLLMDWSVLQRHAKYPLLRPSLVYSSDWVFTYYFAMITNVLIRFIWILYVPSGGPNTIIRLFIAAVLETLRRWQWNFYRLENEHIGNTDQYRVIREVPLPYTFDNDHDNDGDSLADDEEFSKPIRLPSLDGDGRVIQERAPA